MAKGGSRQPKYDPSKFPAFAVTVDMVVLTVDDGALKVLLIKRGEEPLAGSWALPGGFVLEREDIEDAAARELAEETGVDAAKHLVQFRTFGAPDRDPRMRVVTVGYLAILPKIGRVKAATDARHAELVPVRRVGRRPYTLAFDHKLIFSTGLECARSKLETTSVATAFVGDEFTLTDLRAVYELVWDETLDPGNFRRKVLATPGFVVPTGKRAQPGREGGKPPDLYRAGTSGLAELDPPLRRPSHPLD